MSKTKYFPELPWRKVHLTLSPEPQSIPSDSSKLGLGGKTHVQLPSLALTLRSGPSTHGKAGRAGRGSPGQWAEGLGGSGSRNPTGQRRRALNTERREKGEKLTRPDSCELGCRWDRGALDAPGQGGQGPPTRGRGWALGRIPCVRQGRQDRRGGSERPKGILWGETSPVKTSVNRHWIPSRFGPCSCPAAQYPF